MCQAGFFFFLFCTSMLITHSSIFWKGCPCHSDLVSLPIFPVYQEIVWTWPLLGSFVWVTQLQFQSVTAFKGLPAPRTVSPVDRKLHERRTWLFHHSKIINIVTICRTFRMVVTGTEVQWKCYHCHCRCHYASCIEEPQCKTSHKANISLFEFLKHPRQAEFYCWRGQ
jgi:hypothetical protein